jgi:formate hydrogenlyase subunit 6/NADH:ubiquinone oxidoreductase subunit I
VADFETGYCEYTCNLCGQICPTGAIAPLPLDRKQRISMGLAVINEETCLPFAEKQNCVVCEEHCPTPEKAIVFERVVERVQGRELVLDRPKVLEDLCIGCGICEQKCPVRAGAQGAPAGPADGAAREGGGGSAYGGASGYGEASGYGDGEPEGRGGPGERTAREAPSFPTHPHAAIRVRRTGEERIAGR